MIKFWLRWICKKGIFFIWNKENLLSLFLLKQYIIEQENEIIKQSIWIFCFVFKIYIYI